MSRFNEWPDVALGDVAADITVGHVGPMATEYKDSGVPFLRSQNVEPFSLKLEDVKFISDEFHGRLEKSALKPGDVVIVRTGKPGAAAVIPQALPIANCSDLVIVRPGKLLDSRFIAYYLNSAAVHHISAHLVGAVQQHFNVGSARSLKLRLPPIKEQRAISSVLGNLDDKIDLNRRMSQTLEAVARAIFRSWFVDEASEWPSVSIYQAADVIYGAPFSSEQFNERGEGRPLIRIRDLTTQAPTMHTKEEHPKAKLIRPGDILVGMDGEFRARLWRGPCGWLNQRVCQFVPKGDYPPAFVWFSIEEPLEFFERSKTGTTVVHLGKADIDTFRVALPPVELLQRFGELANPLLEKIIVNAQESCTLAELRDTLLPKLLSGEIRVKQAEKIVEEVV